ncbi:serine/threonine protein kinase [Nonomuraea sp. FMUSA5-5]|uniref:Serine/threonine protein kinase n=1 Tax=Nonomuraea composti TaxID=2720023 RepID=A0ABX1B4Y3_9ACTN|nr:serine/threonine protein kinase [Nonomuraea sp. FMUSA5-5]NJP92895.1 serine/threonine protein kinase [Nonomuraea sp. FMUSA5-5]
MRTRKPATLLAGAVLVTTTTLAAVATPASAAGPCGSSYSRVGVYSIGVEKYGYRTGILEVYYSSSTGKNCAITYGDGPYANTTSWKGVVISRGDGSGEDSDAGNYKYYAGPVYVSAPGQCIDVEGISPSWTSVKLNNVHCG